MSAHSESVHFTVLGPPRPKERPRLGKGGRTYTPKRTLEYEAAIRDVGMLHMVRGWDMLGLYRVTVRFVFADNRPRDVDNCLKAVLDGLNRVAWADDSQVVETHASKAVAEATYGKYLSACPCTEVLIERIGDKPVRRTRRRAAGR